MDTQRIMVALDGSTMAEAALPVAESLASRPETVLILVRASEAADGVADDLGAAATYLDTVAAALRDRGFENVETVSLDGPAASVILEAARTHAPDVIVMATSSHSGFGRLVSGSVAETVVHGTQTLVFLVRAGGGAKETMPRRAGSGDRNRAHEVATAS